MSQVSLGREAPRTLEKVNIALQGREEDVRSRQPGSNQGEEQKQHGEFESVTRCRIEMRWDCFRDRSQ